jgi:glycosyltransferase involved in cell wall biosynthesis
MSADAVGGVWTYALDLARGLADHGIRTTLAVPGPAPQSHQIKAAQEVPGLAVERIDAPLDWTATRADEVRDASAKISALARRVRADIVQVNSAPLAAGLKRDVPLIIACHSCVATWWDTVRGTPLPADFRWQRDLAAEAFAGADALVAPSNAFSALTARTYDLPRQPLAIHNGRRAPIPHAERPSFPPGFVFTAGRLWDEGKDIATLEHAAPHIRGPVVAAGPLAGPNGAAQSFQHLRCLGSLPEALVGRWLSGGPVFVSTARYEPFGLAVLEAAQAGCPLVLSDIPTFRELWNGAAAFVPPGDARAFAQAVNAILADPERRSRRGQAARERAARYTPEPMADAMAQLIRDLIAGRGAPAQTHNREKAA